MNKLRVNLFIKIISFIFPILLNLILFYFINIDLGDNFINVLDSAILFNKIDVGKKLFSLWTENNLGYDNSFFAGINFFSHFYSLILLRLNFSPKWIELLIFIISYVGIFYSSLFAFYLVQRKLFNQNKKILFPFFTAFFYTYNIFNISLIGIVDQLFILLVLYPFLVYILIALLNKEINAKYGVALSAILGFTMVVPIFSFAVYGCLFFSFFLLKKNVLSKKNILSWMLIIIVALLLGGPLIFALVHGYTTANPYSKALTSSIGFIFPPYGIMGIFQLFFQWSITSLNTYSTLYFRSIYGLTSSYMVWILVLSSLTIYWQSIKNKRTLLFLMLPLVMAIFLAKGAQKPFDEINTWMYNSNPIFAIFRTPGSKFGIVVMLILSNLILYVLNICKNKVLLSLIITTILLQTWIFFNPVNFIGQETSWWNKPTVKISQDYRDLISLINGDRRHGAILFYPGLSSGHYDLKNGVKFSFQDVLGRYIERPIIYPETNLQFYLAKRNVTEIVNNFDQKTVGQSSIRYIIIRQDFDIRRLNEKATVARALQAIESKNYKKSFSSKLFTIYEVSDKYFKDLITVRTPSREYTPNFKKIAPYHYVVKAKMGDLLGNRVIFRNNYHPDWKILDLSKKSLKATQILVDNFANGWLISPLDAKNPPNPNQDVELDIYFYPQKILISLSVVSIISLICVCSLTAYLFLKKK